MLAIIAMLSELPYYFVALIEQLTGADASVITDIFSKGFAGAVELAEKLLGQI